MIPHRMAAISGTDQNSPRVDTVCQRFPVSAGTLVHLQFRQAHGMRTYEPGPEGSNGVSLRLPWSPGILHLQAG